MHVSGSLPAEQPRCPKYRKYQYQLCGDNKHNGESHHGDDSLLTPSRIKEEPFGYEVGAGGGRGGVGEDDRGEEGGCPNYLAPTVSRVGGRGER